MTACWHHSFDSFRPLSFILSFVRLCFAQADLAVLLGSRPLLHTFYLSCQCASARKHRVSVVLSLYLPSPLHTLYLLFECAWPRKHRVVYNDFMSVSPFRLCFFYFFICASSLKGV